MTKGECLRSKVSRSAGMGSTLPGFGVSSLIDYPRDPGCAVTALCLSFLICAGRGAQVRGRVRGRAPPPTASGAGRGRPPPHRSARRAR